MDVNAYGPTNYYDELFDAQGNARPHALPLIQHLALTSKKKLAMQQKKAESIFFRQGITFNVYGEKQQTEKIFPFDIIPRVIAASEWELIERGLKQRIKALNMFISDVYGAKHILKAGIIPEQHVLRSKNYLAQCEGLQPANDIWVNICGSDLIRDEQGDFFILEDNLRCPSGVSYAIENRNIMKRCFSDAFNQMGVQPIEDYADHLLLALQQASYGDANNANVVVLTPGPFNSAYFEHAFLAQQMGVPLVQPSDLIVDRGLVKMRTTGGLEKVDVIYRRIDDQFIDPDVFNKDSLLGVPGIMQVYRKQQVALINSPGVGIADDKAIYPYVPDMIKFYLKQEPLLANIKTYLCSDPAQCEYVLAQLKDLVVKETDLSGGYGMLIGNQASPTEIEMFRKRITESPANYIAQPIIKLSTAPTIAAEGIAPRHVDLRPFVLSGQSTYVTPGGLTRVALKQGSLVVNSSQGGGSKDTWITRN